MGSNKNDDLRLVQKYRTVVLIYEGLQSEINALLKANGGSSQNMSEKDRDHYRELAHKRDEVMNEMRLFEQQLLQEGDME